MIAPAQCTDFDRALSALEFLDPPIEREPWVRLLMAAHAAGVSEDDARDWSERGENFDESDFRLTWRSIRPGTVTERTLFKAARDAGWSAPPDGKSLSVAERAQRDAERAKHREQAVAERAAREVKAAVRATKIWNEAEPANEHQYLARKRVQAYGLKIGKWEKADPETGDIRVISEQALLIQARDMERNIHSIQAIFPSNFNVLGRDRDYLTGGAKQGHFFPIGQPQTVDGKKIIVIVEGYSTGASVHECTGHAVVVAFDKSNLEPVARVIRGTFHDADIVIFSDRDAEVLAKSGGTKEALKAALAIDGRIVVPEWCGLDGRDANDIHRDGFTWRGTPYPGKEILEYCVRFATPFRSGAFMEMLRECGITANDLAPTPSARDEERRRLQQEENARIQYDQHDISPPIMSVDDMLDDCVWITPGSQVGRLSAPKKVLSFGEFCDLTACSTTEFSDPKSKAKTRKIPNAVLWKKNESRKTVDARTFHAGAGEICRDPDGETALNSWRHIERRKASADVGPFLGHVAYLFEDASEREVFLDWLAHIEQRPGVLPHYGWLHIAANTGTGRNWLASVLARVWRGCVAPNVDLPALLESPFNGQLAGRVLAMVDEVQEGGGENPFRHVNRLKSLVNAEERVINPKFGRQYREHNSCRWLVFSNHDNALPLNDTDRRWRVVRHIADPRSPATYATLYALLEDPEFINAVGVYLRERDIHQFNPGERPPMNAAKRAALDASKSAIHHGAEEIVRCWPVDVVTNGDAAEVLGDGSDKGFTPAMRRALAEAGAIQYGNGRLVKVGGKPAKCWIVRNAERWSDARPADIGKEAARARCGYDMPSATELIVDAGDDGSRAF